MIHAEFMGGPMDGKFMELPEAFETYYFPVVLPFRLDPLPCEFDRPRTLIYERRERRLTKNGWQFRYHYRKGSG